MTPRAPKLRDLSLNATERTAVMAVLQAQQQLEQQIGQVRSDMAEIAADIERRHGLPAGALGDKATHQLNTETWTLEPIEQNGRPK